MKRKKPSHPHGAPRENANYRFVLGTVESIEYSEPMPPGGSKFKYVRGQGLVYVGPRETPPADPKR